jgi:predicted MFS family arabinose efflux permease
LSERHSPKSLISGTCLGAVVAAVLVGLSFRAEISLTLYLLLAVRGFLECLIKQGRAIAVKALSSNSDLGSNNTTVTFFEFSGQTVGAIVAIYALQHFSVAAICFMDAGLFAVAALTAFILPKFDIDAGHVPPPPSLSNVFKQLEQYPPLLFYLSMIVSIVITLQAINQTLRTWLPIRWLGMPSQFVGFTEIISLIGIVMGILVAKRLLRGDKINSSVLTVAVVMSALLLALLFISKVPMLVVTLYFAYMFAFEFSFAYSLSAMLISCPSHMTKGVVALMYAFAYGGVSIFGLGIAIASDFVGLERVAIFVCILLIILLAVQARYHKKNSIQSTV